MCQLYRDTKREGYFKVIIRETFNEKKKIVNSINNEFFIVSPKTHPV